MTSPSDPPSSADGGDNGPVQSRTDGSRSSTSTLTLHVRPVESRSAGSRSHAVERRLRAVDGVETADVSLRAGTVTVRYDERTARPETIDGVVRRSGLVPRAGTDAVADGGALDSQSDLGDRLPPVDGDDSPNGDDDSPESEDGPGADGDPGDAPEDTEAVDRTTLRREAVFVALTFVGMFVGLIAGWLGGPRTLVWGAYAVAYVFGGWYGLKTGIETLTHGAVDIDLLMILAATGALVIGAPFEGAMLLFLFSLSNVLQHYAFGRSRRAIKSLMKLRPDSARVLRDGTEVTVPVEDVVVGDVFVVRPGDRIPLDGAVTVGESTVDQSSITGESVPVAKEPGSEVYGGTINEVGSLEVRVTREAHESTIAKLIHMVEEAQSEKAPTQRLIDRLEQPYVLGVFALTGAAIAIPLFLGHEFDPTFYRAMTLMVAASPCAVVISTPAAVLSAITAGAREGVLFKGGEHVETAATVNAVAFDKTGTLTEGDTRLTDAAVRGGVTHDGRTLDDAGLLALSAAVQSRSEHHLAQATVDAAAERSLDVPDATGFQATVGKGVRAVVDGDTVHIGNRRYVETVLAAGSTGSNGSDGGSIDGLDAGLRAIDALERDGKTSVLVVRESEGDASVLGWLAFTDTIRPGAADMVARLRELGVEQVVMLTGDNERVAHHVAEEVGIDEVNAELLPEEKVGAIEELRDRYGTVAMVGDGVNDAPALATATVGIGMGGAGTDVALETADIVLMSDDISKIPYALGLSRATRRTLFLNLSIAFAAIAIMIVAILTAGIPLPVAVVGHEGSTVLVSLIGLRLLRYHA